MFFEWNAPWAAEGAGVAVLDDTLRDGLQSPSARIPSLRKKLRILDQSASIGIDAIILGLPAAGGNAISEIGALAQHAARRWPTLELLTAVRTHPKDIAAHIEACNVSGVAITAAVFIGCSPIRRLVETWSEKQIIDKSRQSIQRLVEQDIPVLFVTEDTTRTNPDMLQSLYREAILAGASRVCVADTVGHAEPSGAARVVELVREVVNRTQPGIGIDWHGHNDRGLGLINALIAAESGASRIHTTVLGLGERTGNTALEQFVHFAATRFGRGDLRLERLTEYCQMVSDYCCAPFPSNCPIVGTDAHRTSSGIHAAAILKALARDDQQLADIVYSAVPAAPLGRKQKIEIGPMSGMGNALYCLGETVPNLPEDKRERYAQFLLDAAKRSDQVLDKEDVHQIVNNIPDVGAIDE